MITKCVRVLYERTKKYLAELIGNEFMEWTGKKIMINAPTGMGKSTFVVEVLLQYLRQCGEKMIILCNRKLLRMQYWGSLLKYFTSYEEIERSVSVMTYQELAERMKRGASLKNILDQFGTIVCDECHYFYADSDFNSFGTYVLLQALVAAGAAKTMIFMSATIEEVKPLIVRTIKNCLWRLNIVVGDRRIRDENHRILEYDFSGHADYDRFRCICVPDWETLCEVVAGSSKKTVIFVNDKAKGVDIAEKLCKTGKVDKTDIAIINADNIESNNEVVRNLTLANRLFPHILITTTVLDNGVSIHDPDVGNVVIETESKIEFLQMIGRIRAENVDNCTLYFVQRDEKEFATRKHRYEEEVKAFEKLTVKELRENRRFYLQVVLNNDEGAEFYRKALVWMQFKSQFYDLPESEALSLNREEGLYVNEFAKKKTGNMYMAESQFCSLAFQDPLKVVYEQMSWIGKTPEELEVMGSTYRERRIEEFVEELLKVQDYTWNELNEFKEKIVERYKKDLFDNMLAKNGTISKDKLERICEQYGLELITKNNAEKRIKTYSIKRKE